MWTLLTFRDTNIKYFSRLDVLKKIIQSAFTYLGSRAALRCGENFHPREKCSLDSCYFHLDSGGKAGF